MLWQAQEAIPTVQGLCWKFMAVMTCTRTYFRGPTIVMKIHSCHDKHKKLFPLSKVCAENLWLSWQAQQPISEVQRLWWKYIVVMTNTRSYSHCQRSVLKIYDCHDKHNNLFPRSNDCAENLWLSWQTQAHLSCFSHDMTIIMVIFKSYFSREHITYLYIKKQQNGVNIELGKTNRLKALWRKQNHTWNKQTMCQ